jgi:magnesium transporter
MSMEQIREWIEQKDFKTLKTELMNTLPADIAEQMEDLTPQDLLLVFRLLPKEVAAEVFSLLPMEQQSEISQLINEVELQKIVDELYFDDKIDLLEEMPANVVKRILAHTSEKERRLINQFLNYPEYSAGSLMTIEFVDLKKEMSVTSALTRIRMTAPSKETIYTCYAIDPYRRLEGIVSLEELVLAREDMTVGEVMRGDFVSVHTHDDQEEVAEIFKKYDLLSAPVVDNEGRLVGIITVDDIMDVIEEENTEDLYHMAAMNPSEKEYLNTGVFSLAKKRILWLMALMISATLSAAVITRFQYVLDAVGGLVAFIPMIMGTGGNAGAQSSTVVIRSLALGEVDFRDLFRVMFKEVQVSLLVGAGLAVLNFLRLLFLSHTRAMVALTVSLALIATILFAKLMGSLLPMLAKKIGLDPAIMASPLISTLVDATSLTMYFTLAIWILSI